MPVADPQAPSGQSAASPCVLVVEDSRTLRVLTAKFLERHGYNVLVAANADEARRALAGNVLIDVLLTDVVLPGASGPELTSRLMEQFPRLKVVYMSGHSDEAVIQQGVRAGIPFLYKPFTPEALARTIQNVLKQ
jgi:DNA-binding NtrC family response regulator